MTLQYLGPDLVGNTDLAYKGYVTQVKSQDLSESSVVAAVNAALALYADKAYVDNGDAQLADKAFVDAGDASRMKIALKDVPNGILALDATARANPSRFNMGNTQRYWRGPWGPVNTFNSQIDTAGETTLFTVPITSPGFATYKPLVFGLVDAFTTLEAEHPMVVVRFGSEAGEIIASGRGLAERLDQGQRVDEFDRTGNTLGSTFWSENYFSGSDGQAATNGNVAYWDDSFFVGGPGPREGLFRRVLQSDRYTLSDFQVIRAQVNERGEDRQNPFQSQRQYLRLYMRMNDAETEYVCWEITENDVRLLYAVPGVAKGDEPMLGDPVGQGQSDGDLYTAYAGGTDGNPRVFHLLRNGNVIASVPDTGNVTALSANNRGWGFGYRAANRNLGQTTPPSLRYLSIGDHGVNRSAINITPVSPNLVAPRTGAATLYVRGLRSGSASTASFFPFYPKMHVMCVAV